MKLQKSVFSKKKKVGKKCFALVLELSISGGELGTADDIDIYAVRDNSTHICLGICRQKISLLLCPN